MTLCWHCEMTPVQHGGHTCPRCMVHFMRGGKIVPRSVIDRSHQRAETIQRCDRLLSRPPVDTRPLPAQYRPRPVGMPELMEAPESNDAGVPAITGAADMVGTLSVRRGV